MRKYNNGCDQCVFLDHYTQDGTRYDLYYCPQKRKAESGEQLPSMPTLLARYSNKRGDYLSGLQIAKKLEARDPHDPLVKALQLARERGLEGCK